LERDVEQDLLVGEYLKNELCGGRDWKVGDCQQERKFKEGRISAEKDSKDRECPEKKIIRRKTDHIKRLQGEKMSA